MKIFIDENMPPQLAEGLSILEKPNNEGVEVYSIQKEYGRGILDEDWIPKVGSSKGIVIIKELAKKNRPPFAFKITPRKIEKIS